LSRREVDEAGENASRGREEDRINEPAMSDKCP
jgi:hypothetical protein